MENEILITEQDVTEMLAAWSLLADAIKPTHQGTVNTTFIVEAQTGKFVFKLYDNTTTTAQIHYEHSLLAHLDSCNLSFAVPAPVPTKEGQTLLQLKYNNSLVRAALQHFIPGQPAQRHNLNHTRAAGKALGELHHALIEFDPQGKLAQLPTWGNLEHIHPLITNPLEVPKLLSLDSIQQKQLLKSLTELLETAPQLYKTLPLQTTHADYLCPNILVDGDRLIGIIDFEFATYDLRLLDFIAAVDHFTRIGSTVPVWERIEAFSTGYQKHISLTKPEIASLTLTWRLQQASCIIYWTGWLREGKVTHQSVLNGVTKMLLLEDWLKENTDKLIAFATN